MLKNSFVFILPRIYNINMTMPKKKIALIVFIISLLMSCQTVPVTGRQQVHLIPDDQINAMSFDAYDEFLSKNKVIVNTEEAKQVSRVGKNIQHAVERYFKNKGLSSRLKGYKWEFNLVDDKTVNAWCMPGGKVVVYKGILPVAAGDEGLAVVLGHEIAHAVAGHGNERMSQGLLVQMGGAALSVALSQKPEETQNLFMAAFGLGAQVGVLLPYSRLHESEADHLGLIFMAMAGYDPKDAVSFWQRMSSMKQGASPPEILSTHPADRTRINNIKKLLPEAMKYYKKAQ
jgi:predicted Zn-dependent protease